MEELLELRAHIEQGRYAKALSLIGEMEEMSRDDKIQKSKISSTSSCST
jgi:pentatricopeptide repeat protein